MKRRLDQLFVLEAADRLAADSKQLRVPTLEERVELYLRAVYGQREFTRQEYLRARDLILDEMATHFKGNSVAGSANKPAGLVDIALGRTISLSDETISQASSQPSESAPLRAFARRYDLVSEELAGAIHFDETPGAPSAKLRAAANGQARHAALAAKNAEETRAPRRQRRISRFLSSLPPRTLAWSATAAAVVILVQAAVITAVVVKEQGAPSGQYGKLVTDQQIAELNSQLVLARRQTSEAKARLDRTDGLIRFYSLGRHSEAGVTHASSVRDQIRDHRGSILEEAERQRESDLSNYEIAKQAEQELEKRLAEAVSRSQPIN